MSNLKFFLSTGKCTNPYGKTKFFMEEIIKDVSAANNVRKISYFLKFCRTVLKTSNSVSRLAK